jgi:hypothetical protein
VRVAAVRKVHAAAWEAHREIVEASGNGEAFGAEVYG